MNLLTEPILIFQVDAGTCTDVSTLTEPENLGPCEPGTSVNLEGIVWHETDTGTDRADREQLATLTSNKNGTQPIEYPGYKFSIFHQ